MNKSILEEVLKMPPDERITLAEIILQSINREESEIRQVWIQEVNDRIKAYRDGRATVIDFEDQYDKS
ncbi:MAG: addiction module protein [Calditrichaeota bacterium]|nr:addiction module protein [Calditrichota bacterium]